MTNLSGLASLAARSPAHPPAKGDPVSAALTGPSELLALAHTELQPVAVVSGTAVGRISTSFVSSNRLGEIESLTSAMEAARTQAVSRLIAATRDYGAAGVVGVQPRVRWHGHRRRDTLELTLVGTAVATRDGTSDDKQIFTATLDGVAVARLMWSGWRPVGLTVGVSVFGFPRRGAGSWFRSNWHGGEAAHPTSALYAAREAAIARLQADARSLNADGVLGVEMSHDQHVWGRRAIELSAIGTAVSRVAGPENLPASAFTLSVADVIGAARTDLR